MLLFFGDGRDENTMDYEGETASRWRKKGRMQVNTQKNRISEKHPLKHFILIFMQRSTEITLGE